MSSPDWPKRPMMVVKESYVLALERRYALAVEAHQCIVAMSPINSAEAQISGRTLAQCPPLPGEKT